MLRKRKKKKIQKSNDTKIILKSTMPEESPGKEEFLSLG